MNKSIRPPGYYWVRYDGDAYIFRWLPIRDMGAWLVPDSDIFLTDDDDDVKVLSGPLEPPKERE